MGKTEEIVLSPIPREIRSPSDLSEDLARQQIYWQGRFIYLDGTPVEYDPITQLDNEESTLWTYKFSHNGRYLAYRYDDVILDDGEAFPGFPGIREKIGLWDLESGERKVLVEIGRDFPKGAMLGGIAFTPDDEKVLFAVLWRDDQEEQHVDLATVDTISGIIERLGMDPLPVYSFDLNISPDGKWAVLAETTTLNNQVCLLVNLEKRTLECLTFERGWYSTVRFTPDSHSVLYDHSKEIRGAALYRSKIDGTENTLLVLGLSSFKILLVDEKEIVFSGATYDNYKCSNIYVINLDGSDLRRLSYLGQECLTDEELTR